MLILGIETSCDETAVALYNPYTHWLAHRVHSQSIHQLYGGVVPELAARDHLPVLHRLLADLLGQESISPCDLDAIAYTAGPGLASALRVGSSFAVGLGYALGIPSYPVHHLEGHLYALKLLEKPPSPPFLVILMSGGHTLIMDVVSWGSYRIIGQTLDDAAGEAFDKTAQLLGLSYPGGAALSRLAQSGDPQAIQFKTPMTDGYDFSFSGLKTCVARYVAQHEPLTDTLKANIAVAFEQTVAKLFQIKVEKALMLTHRRHVVMCGGVAANHRIRQALETIAQVSVPPSHLCTDNAAMIACLGASHAHQQPCIAIDHQNRYKIPYLKVWPRWNLEHHS